MRGPQCAPLMGWAGGTHQQSRRRRRRGTALRAAVERAARGGARTPLPRARCGSDLRHLRLPTAPSPLLRARLRSRLHRSLRELDLSSVCRCRGFRHRRRRGQGSTARTYVGPRHSSRSRQGRKRPCPRVGNKDHRRPRHCCSCHRWGRHNHTTHPRCHKTGCLSCRCRHGRHNS